jgi:acetylornithine/succinyldiaminopimelate/putrescine aminotransferase
VGESVTTEQYRHGCDHHAWFISRPHPRGHRGDGSGQSEEGLRAAVQGFVHVEFNNGPELLGAVQDPNTVAILLEPVQGERGIHAATRSFCGWRASCATGTACCSCSTKCSAASDARAIGAAGRRSPGHDLMPDAVSWAKGIAGGFPLGAIWVSDREVTLKSGETKPLCDLLGPGSHGTTFGGTPLVSAGAE